MRKLKYNNQTGDTIIEVLLAVTVVGLVLGASFSISNRALKTGRHAQEQTEALKLVETQIEKLKYMASQIAPGDPLNGTIFDGSAGTLRFCINDQFVKILESSPTFTNDCEGRSGLYDQLVEYDPDPSINLYKVSVTWTALTGNPANVQISYKLYRR